MKGRDLYADLEKIEERGKRKKEKKGLFGKKEEPEASKPASKASKQPKPSSQKPAASPQRRQAPRARLAEPKPRAVAKTPEQKIQEPAKTLQTDEKTKSSASVSEKRLDETEAKQWKSGTPGEQSFTDEELEPLEPMESPEDYKAKDLYADLEKIEERGSKKKQQQPAPVLKSFFGKKESEKKSEPEKTSELVPEPPPEPRAEPQVEFGVCRACGASLTADATSCEICGAKLLETPELQPAEPQPLLSEPEQETPELVPAQETEEAHPAAGSESKGSEIIQLVEEEKYEQVLVREPAPSEEEHEPEQTPVLVSEPEIPVEVAKPAEPVQEPIPEKPPETPAQEENPADAPQQEWKPLEGRARKRADEELLDFKRKLDKAFKAGTLTREQCLVKVKEKEIELGLRTPMP